MKGPKALFNTIRQVERAKVEQVMGKDYDENKERLIAGKVAAAVGKNYSYLANATLYDAQTANKMAVAYGPEPSLPGALGQTADQAKQAIGAAVDRLPAMLQAAGNLSMTGQLINDPMALTRSDADTTPQQKALTAVSGIVPQRGVSNVIPSLTGRPQYQLPRLPRAQRHGAQCQ
jgi:hypothetical protein